MGVFGYNNQNSTAHTVAYEAWVGKIPTGLHVRHTCDNPPCINPEHLLLGTHADNMRDKSSRGRISGERNPACKYTDNQRDLAKSLKGSLKEVASLLGMSESYVCILRKMQKIS